MGLELRIIQAFWFILPAYFANAMPVQFSKIRLLKKYAKPIDGGKSFRGVRLLGKGKTWRGFIIGIASGGFIGILQMLFHPEAVKILDFFMADEMITLPHTSFELAFMLSLGTLVGDMAASFVKRQAGLKSGDPAPLLDQLDFVFGAFFFAWLLTGTIDYDRFFVIIVITPVVHVLGNIIAWIWKLKKNPW